MPIIEPPPPDPLFPAWDTPKGGFPAIYGWRAYTNPTTSITSVIGNVRPLSDIPSGVLAMVYYHSRPGDPNVRQTFDYGDARPYTFYMPDGSTRENTTNMSGQAYSNLVGNLWASIAYPT